MKRSTWLWFTALACCIGTLRLHAEEPTTSVAGVGVAVAGGFDREPSVLRPGWSRIVTHADLAWLVYAPTDSRIPIIVATFRLDGTPTPPVPPVPVPGTVAGVVILENQEDRTAKQAAVMDDPTWQAAAKAKGLTWKIEDKDVPADQAPWMSVLLNAVQEGQHAFPVVCLVDADGKPVQVLPLPATAEEMLKLIGGVE